MIFTAEESYVDTKAICKSTSTAKVTKSAATQPLPPNKLFARFRNGGFLPQKDDDEDDPDKQFLLLSETKWSDDTEKVVGYRSFTQEALGQFIIEGGFSSKNCYNAGDFFGMT
jgi:hypothetical protein